MPSTRSILSDLSKLPLTRKPTVVIANEEDITAFFTSLIQAKSNARSVSEENSVSICKAKYLLYLRHFLTSGEFTTWRDVDNRLLVSSINALDNHDLLKELATGVVDRIIDEINSPVESKLKLEMDDKSELLQLIENLDSYGVGIVDLNADFKKAKIVVAMHECCKKGNAVAAKGP